MSSKYESNGVIKDFIIFGDTSVKCSPNEIRETKIYRYRLSCPRPIKEQYEETKQLIPYEIIDCFNGTYTSIAMTESGVSFYQVAKAFDEIYQTIVHAKIMKSVYKKETIPDELIQKAKTLREMSVLFYSVSIYQSSLLIQ